VGLKSNYDSHIEYKTVDDFIDTQFLNWVTSDFPYLKGVAETMSGIGYVDHQSVLAFPRYRNSMKLNLEFLSAFIAKVVENPNLVILGGNDNEPQTHPLLAQDMVTEAKTVKLIFSAIRDRDSKTVMAEFDNVIGDFVLSVGGSGNLMRVKL
jgi:hypothetical protein